MGRPKGSKNKATLFREANMMAARARAGEPLRVDSLEALDEALRWFYMQAQAEIRRKKPDEAKIKAWWTDVVDVAKAIAPHRHARISTTKLIGDPNKPVSVDHNATKEQLRAEILAEVVELGLIPPAGVTAPTGVANRKGNGKTVN